MIDEKPDYGDWSEEELSEELLDVEADIQRCQSTISTTRKHLNTHMDLRDDLIDLIRQKSKATRGWHRKRLT